MGEVVRAIDKACFVHGAHEHLESNDGIDDDDEDDKEGNLDERKERHHNCIEHNLNITFVFGAQDKGMSSICFRRYNFNRTCKLGTPETSRSGLRTLKARSAFASKPSNCEKLFRLGR